MSRGELMERCRSLGLTNPERLTRDLEDDRVEGALAWYEHEKFKLGSNVGTGLLARTLMDGGVADFEAPKERTKPRAPWWGDGNERGRWVDENVPELPPDEAEAAVISIANAKREITPERVREWAQMDRELDEAFYAGEGEFETRSGKSSDWASYVARKS